MSNQLNQPRHSDDQVAVKLEQVEEDLVYEAEDCHFYNDDSDDTLPSHEQQQQQQQQQKLEILQQYQLPQTSFYLDEEDCDFVDAFPEPASSPTSQQGFKPKVGRKGKRLLWQFLLHDLLMGRSDLSWHPDQLGNPGVFAFKDPNSAARRWGFYKENANMSYEKMSRCIRDYYTRPRNRYFGVMQHDGQNPKPAGSCGGGVSSINGVCSSSSSACSKRRLHFAFNLRHPSVARYIRQFASGYYHRLVVMKLV